MGLTNAELGLVLTTVAGSATALGAAVVFSERLVQLASKPFLAGALGLSSGVMLYVSFVEIFVKSLDGFADSSAFGDSDAAMATAALFGGMGFMSGLDASCTGSTRTARRTTRRTRASTWCVPPASFSSRRAWPVC